MVHYQNPYTNKMDSEWIHYLNPHTNIMDSEWIHYLNPHTNKMDWVELRRVLCGLFTVDYDVVFGQD